MSAPSIVPAAPAPALDAAASPRAIVAEDDADCRLGLAVMLRSLGFEVTGARDGQEALAWFRSMGRVSLVVTDLVMPRLDGLHLARRLRALDPRLAVLAITGAGFERERELRAEGLHLLPKPFDRREFTEAVRAALR